jgi:formylglycine-generating enzyme required for sulfatase activity
VDLDWWRDTLAELVKGIDLLARPRDGLLTDVEQRLETARTIDAKSLSGKAVARAWKDALEDIADTERCPGYNGLQLDPQLGLRPVGKDPASGLWEFAMPHTGTVPQRRADGQLALEDDHAIVVVLIPGGTGQLGAQARDRAAPNHDLLARRNEGPVHEVELAPYFLSKYAMTQAQWERAMRCNPSRYPIGMRIGGIEQTAQHPVENVTWNECQEAVRRLGLALPTEVQWEYAARAGTGTPWWTGDQRDSLVGAVNLADQAARRGGATWAAIQDWLDLDDGYTVHAPVDFDRANPFGLHGVHGNVWEWCRDALIAYDVTPDSGDGLRAQPGSTTRVFRGGGFRNTAAQSRVSSRLGDVPEKRSSDLGLRPARIVDGLTGST